MLTSVHLIFEALPLIILDSNNQLLQKQKAPNAPLIQWPIALRMTKESIANFRSLVLFDADITKLKGCVHYIFASLFCMPKREDLWNKEKCFSFHFRVRVRLFSFLRQSNFKFSDIQMSWRYHLSMHETQNTFYWITWEANTAC